VPSPWIRRGLFGVALLTIPLPYRVAEGGHVPAAWLATVSAMVVTSAISQGGNVSAIIARWMTIQAVLAIAVAYLAARVVEAGMRRTVAADRQWMAFLAVAATALAVASQPIFGDTAVRGGAPTNLIGIFALR